MRQSYFISTWSRKIEKSNFHLEIEIIEIIEVIETIEVIEIFDNQPQNFQCENKKRVIIILYNLWSLFVTNHRTNYNHNSCSKITQIDHFDGISEYLIRL